MFQNALKHDFSINVKSTTITKLHTYKVYSNVHSSFLTHTNKLRVILSKVLTLINMVGYDTVENCYVAYSNIHVRHSQSQDDDRLTPSNYDPVSSGLTYVTRVLGLEY